MYSVVEQHLDGSWWYHPGYTFATEEEANKAAEDFSKRNDNRPVTVFEHTEPMFQKWSTCTRDFVVFEFGGLIKWPEKRAGEFIIR